MQVDHVGSCRPNGGNEPYRDDHRQSPHGTEDVKLIHIPAHSLSYPANPPTECDDGNDDGAALEALDHLRNHSLESPTVEIENDMCHSGGRLPCGISRYRHD